MIAPSILNSNFLKLGEAIDMLNKSESDWIHMDIMDGSFVPNISFGIPIVKAVHDVATKPLDVHLMIVHPRKYLEAFSKAGAYMLNIHYEACPDDLEEAIGEIRQLGCRPAITLNPDTPVEKVFDVAHLVDMILIMSVFPGFGGQKFIGDTYARVKQLKAFLVRENLSTLIEVDGGVSTANAKTLYNIGADVLVVGSYIFRAEDPIGTIHKLRSQAANQ
jgi:ribulose-phosphate 3-epimerase